MSYYVQISIMHRYVRISAVFGAIVAATVAVLLLPRDTLALATFIGGAAIGFEYLTKQEDSVDVAE